MTIQQLAGNENPMYLKTLLGLLLVSVSTPDAHCMFPDQIAPKALERPNILFILADDLGYGHWAATDKKKSELRI